MTHIPISNNESGLYAFGPGPVGVGWFGFHQRLSTASCGTHVDHAERLLTNMPPRGLAAQAQWLCDQRSRPTKAPIVRKGVQRHPV